MHSIVHFKHSNTEGNKLAQYVLLNPVPIDDWY